MNEEVKKSWVAALRSGEYKQGRMVLYDGDSYCCLGVLCDLALKDGVVQQQPSVFANVEFLSLYNSKDHSETNLPLCVANWAGLDDTSPRVDNSPIVDLNDGGFSFLSLADLIEEYL